MEPVSRSCSRRNSPYRSVMARSLLGSLLDRSPIPHTSERKLTFLTREKSGRSIQLEQMEAVSTLFGVVDRIASSVASVDWHLYRGEAEVLVHPALSVWNNPNPHMTQSEFLEASQQHYELVGEYWWTIGRAKMLSGGGPPLELWPVRPDRMRPVKHPEEFISGYVYGNGDEEIPLALDQVIYGKRNNPTNAYRGLSPIASLMLDIEGEQAAAAFNANFFKNNAEPGGIIETDKTLSDPEFDQLVERWNRSHRGVSNAHRVAVLEKGTWKDRSYSHRDMQFGDLRTFNRSVMMEAYGFPKPLLGIVTDVNRANAEAAEYVFARWLVVPRLEKIRDSLNHDFLPMFGSMGNGYSFDFADPVPSSVEDERADRDSAVGAALALIDHGADWDETLAAFGLPDLTRTTQTPV